MEQCALASGGSIVYAVKKKKNKNTNNDDSLFYCVYPPLDFSQPLAGPAPVTLAFLMRYDYYIDTF